MEGDVFFVNAKVGINCGLTYCPINSAKFVLAKGYMHSWGICVAFFGI
jgi:hypothetical protein